MENHIKQLEQHYLSVHISVLREVRAGLQDVIQQRLMSPKETMFHTQSVIREKTSGEEKAKC